MVALYHENIEQHPKRTSLVRHYKDQWNWSGFEFPLAVQKTVKFEKKNTAMAVKELVKSKKSIYTAYWSEFNE